MKLAAIIEILFMAALAIAASLLILWNDPTHFWEDIWLPMVAIASIGFWRWWMVRHG